MSFGYGTARRLGVAQTVASGAASAQSAAFGARVIRVIGSLDAFILIGGNPTATAASHFIKAGEEYYFSVAPNEKLAAIQSVAVGVVYISEMDD